MERMGRVSGICHVAQHGAEPQLCFGGVHYTDQPIPSRLEVVLQVNLYIVPQVKLCTD